MLKNNMILLDFDLFINPTEEVLKKGYKYIPSWVLSNCDYVRYIVIPVINGEINGVPLVFSSYRFPIDISFDYYEVVVYAINYIDNFVLEVLEDNTYPNLNKN